MSLSYHGHCRATVILAEGQSRAIGALQRNGPLRLIAIADGFAPFFFQLLKNI
jgi:hypothetical protein